MPVIKIKVTQRAKETLKIIFSPAISLCTSTFATVKSKNTSRALIPVISLKKQHSLRIPGKFLVKLNSPAKRGHSETIEKPCS
jgi:hypothetical protein